MTAPSPLRSLPRVDRLAAHPDLVATGAPEALRVAASRQAVDTARRSLLADPDAAVDPVAAAVLWLQRTTSGSLQPVLNATGVIVHTNLGRAPLNPEAVAAALGACTLEYDLEAGARGSRRDHVEGLLVDLSGAEAALVVNNNAAAVMLLLAGLCAGRDVLISRGELVEIGGSFRVPDILAASGARLREVGTTNRTWPADYLRGHTPETAALLRVHPSNYAITGFAHRPTPEEVGAAARELGVLYLDDLGSATFGPLPAPLDGADRVARALRAGADAVCFSGDKLLGGAQAGILLGRRALVDALARHPLARALRPDKLALAALEYTLLAHRRGALADIPVARMLHTSLADLEARAHALTASLADLDAELAVTPCADAVGGGSHPDEHLPGLALAVRAPTVGATRLATALRAGSPPVIAVVNGGRVHLHLRTVPPAADAALAAALRRAVALTVDTAPPSR